MEHEVWYKYPQAVKKLPEDIYFITSQELEDMYPDKTPKERAKPDHKRTRLCIPDEDR